MSRLSRFAALMLSLLFVTAFVCQSWDASAQEKKTDKKAQDKKVEKKADTKDEKKTDTKDEKKPEIKEEKKEPFVPDQPAVELKGHTDWVFVVAYSADGKTLASASRDRTAKVWDLAAKKELQTLKGHPTNIKGLAYHDGRVYASTGKFDKEKKAWEGEIRIWDVKAGKPVKSLFGHSDTIEALAITKDGKFLASGSEDQTAKIWDLAAGKDVQTLKGHTGVIHALAFSPDGSKLATASEDRTVKLWDAQTGKDIATFKTAEKSVTVKDPKTGKESQAKEYGRPFASITFSPDGKRLAAGTQDGLIKIYDVDGQKEVKELSGHDGIWALAFSPDGTRLASAGWDQTIKIWDPAAGTVQQTIKAHLGTVTTLSFHPTAPQLASGGLDGLIKIWALKK